MRRPSPLLVPLLAALMTSTAVSTAAAQRLADTRLATFDGFAPAPDARPASLVPPDSVTDELGLALAGVGGGLVGLVVGGYAGATLEQQFSRDCYEYCGLTGGLIGAAVGSGVLIPYAVHLANHQRGDFGQSLAASGAVLVAGMILTAATDRGEPLLVVPFAQIIVSAGVQRATTRAAAEAQRKREEPS